MTGHPRESLPLIAEGKVPPDEVREHVAACGPCAAALAALSRLDLDYAWEGIEAELDAPARSFIERLLTAVGLEPSVGRFAALTPSLRPAWLMANASVLAVAVAAMLVGGPTELSPVLAVAPVVAAVLVAFAYGPAVDPSYEVVAATPLSPITALLVRLTLVLFVNSVLVGVAQAVAGGGRGTLAWLLPMAGVALLATVVAVRSQPIVGAAAGVFTWSFVVLVAMSVSTDPGRVLWGGEAQVLYGVTTTTCLLLLVRWAHAGLIVAPRVAR